MGKYGGLRQKRAGLECIGCRWCVAAYLENGCHGMIPRAQLERPTVCFPWWVFHESAGLVSVHTPTWANIFDTKFPFWKYLLNLKTICVLLDAVVNREIFRSIAIKRTIFPLRACRTELMSNTVYLRAWKTRSDRGHREDQGGWKATDNTMHAVWFVSMYCLSPYSRVAEFSLTRPLACSFET